MSRLEQAIETDLWLERRMEERKPIVGSLIFEHQIRNNARVGYESITKNVSSSGACIYTTHRLEPGRTITIYGKAVGSTPRRGHIRWCRKIEGDIFSIGLSLS